MIAGHSNVNRFLNRIQMNAIHIED